MTLDRTLVRLPQQRRSRESFERVLDSAAELIEEQGLDAVTLGEVSRRSGVSIGSIYGRVEGKDDLIRAALLRMLQRMDESERELLSAGRWAGQALHELLPAVLDVIADSLARNANQLRACMQRATADPVVGAAGREGYGRLESAFTSLLLERRGEIGHPDPDVAVRTCFSITWATLARHYGFGMIRRAAAETNWGEIRSELALMFTLYLQTPHRS
jgi:AcrR family transcriptional regulator